MGKIIKLGMLFDEGSVPDFGDIERVNARELNLTSDSLPKLTDNVTRAVCGAAFDLQAGTQALVVDTGAVLVYHPDAWHYVKQARRTDGHYGSLSVCVERDGAGYILSEEDDEKIVFSVINSSEQVVLSKEMFLYHYKGNGIYSYKLNLEDAHTIHNLGKNLTAGIAVYSGETDITSTVTIKYPDVMEWYDAHVVFDTGV